MASEENDKTSVFKTIMKVAFSHIGLSTLVILYSMLGGFLFELLEEQNEIWACKEARQEYDDMENETLFRYSKISKIQTSIFRKFKENVIYSTFQNNAFYLINHKYVYSRCRHVVNGLMRCLLKIFAEEQITRYNFIHILKLLFASNEGTDLPCASAPTMYIHICKIAH